MKIDEESSRAEKAIGQFLHKQDADLEADDVHDDFGGLDEEDEKEIRKYRDERLTQLKSTYQQKQEDMIKGHGSYTEITEVEFLPKVTSSKYVICHFYHKDFERCKIIDKHLRDISKKHIEARFIYIDAEKTPFFI